jgi:hypothetical protein
MHKIKDDKGLPLLLYEWRPCKDLVFYRIRSVLCRLDRQGRVLAWLRSLATCTLLNSFYIDTEEARKTGD